MHGCRGGLAAGQESLHHCVRVVLGRLEHLASVVGGDSSHVVVDGGDNGDGLLQSV